MKVLDGSSLIKLEGAKKLVLIEELPLSIEHRRALKTPEE
jgi:hypothetical protein